MRLDVTALFWAAPEGGYVARVAEIPAAMSQGETLEEARANLADAIQLVIDAHRADAATRLADEVLIREWIVVEVPDPEF
jgi:predicted RNase H-like HicB family nuclease